MNWIKHEDQDYYSCNTPIGRYDIVGSSDGYNTYYQSIDKLSAGKDLETAKEDVRTHINVTFYKLKLYLEV